VEEQAKGVREIRSMRQDDHVVFTTVEDGWTMATVPELPGAVTQGRDMDEARANIREAVELLLETYRDNAVKDAPGGAVWETVCVGVSAS
jgi:predicted RNase H-like HicB family nuclease